MNAIDDRKKDTIERLARMLFDAACVEPLDGDQLSHLQNIAAFLQLEISQARRQIAVNAVMTPEAS